MDISLESHSQDISSSSVAAVNEQTSDGGVEFCYDETENPTVHPTKEDVESMRKKLVESLRDEQQMVERQRELYEEQRDLKIAIDRAEADTKLLELQKTRESLKAQLEEAELQHA